MERRSGAAAAMYMNMEAILESVQALFREDVQVLTEGHVIHHRKQGLEDNHGVHRGSDFSVVLCPSAHEREHREYRQSQGDAEE